MKKEYYYYVCEIEEQKSLYTEQGQQLTIRLAEP